MNVGEVIAKFRLDTQGFETNISNIKSGMSSLDPHTEGVFSRIKQNWMGLAASATAAYMAIGRAMDYMKMASMAEQASSAFKTVATAAGESSEKIVAAMKKASNETIDDSDLMQKALKGMTQGLKGEDIIKITEIARVAARTAGTDVKTAYEEITDAIANNMPRALRRYGLITQEQMSLVNKAIAAGVDDINLLSIVTANAALKTAQMGEITETTAEKFQKFAAQTHELKEQIGTYLLAALKGAYDSLRLLSSAVLYTIGCFAQYYSYIIKGWELYDRYILRNKEMADNLKKQGTEMTNTANLMMESSSDLFEKVMASNLTTAEGTKKANQDQIKSSQLTIEQLTKQLKATAENAEAAKKAAQEREAAEKRIAEAVEKSTLDIDSFQKAEYEKEFARIDLEAEKFRKAGVSKTIIEKFIQKERLVIILKNAEEIEKTLANIEYEGIAGRIKTEEKIREDAAKELLQKQKDLVKRWTENWESAHKKEGQTIAESLKETEDNIKSQEEMYRDLFYKSGQYAKEYLFFRKELLEIEIDKLREKGTDEITLREYKARKIREIELETSEAMLKYSNDFFYGVRVAYNKYIDDQETWAKQGFKIWNAVFGKDGALSNTLTSFFTDVFKGQLKTAEDYFNAFKDAILSAFAKMIAEMITQWAVVQLFGTMGSPTGLGSLLGIGVNAAGGLTMGGGPAAASSTGGAGGGGGGITSLAGLALKPLYSWLTGGTAAAATASTASSTGSLTASTLGSQAMFNAGAGEVAGAGAGTSTAAGASAGLGAAYGLVGLSAIMAAYGIYNWSQNKGGAVNPFAKTSGAFSDKGVKSQLAWQALASSGVPVPTGMDEDYWMALYGNAYGKPAFDLVSSPWWDPENLYRLYTQSTGQPVTIDSIRGGHPLQWLSSQPEYQNAVAQMKAMRFGGWPGALEAWAGGGYPSGEGGAASPSDFAAKMARGGIISEPVWGVGKSGQRYEFGEEGPERVTPLSDGVTGGVTINAPLIHIEGNLIADENTFNQFVEKIDYRLQKLARWGH